MLFLSLLACYTTRCPPIDYNHNSPPVAEITSHNTREVLELVEGEAVMVSGHVQDQTHEFDELRVTWFLGTDTLSMVCEGEPDEFGQSICEITAVEGALQVIMVVTDTSGASGDDALGLAVDQDPDTGS